MRFRACVRAAHAAADRCAEESDLSPPARPWCGMDVMVIGHTGFEPRGREYRMCALGGVEAHSGIRLRPPHQGWGARSPGCMHDQSGRRRISAHRTRSE